MQSDTLETLFGGAAGGGKSHGQLLDALRFAVCYPGSRQLMLRRTMPELERSLVPAALRWSVSCGIPEGITAVQRRVTYGQMRLYDV